MAWGCWGAVQGTRRADKQNWAEKQNWELSPLSCLLRLQMSLSAWINYAGTEMRRENPCSPSSRCQGWQEAKQLLQTPARVLPQSWGPEPGLGLWGPG